MIEWSAFMDNSVYELAGGQYAETMLKTLQVSKSECNFERVAEGISDVYCDLDFHLHLCSKLGNKAEQRAEIERNKAALKRSIRLAYHTNGFPDLVPRMQALLSRLSAENAVIDEKTSVKIAFSELLAICREITGKRGLGNSVEVRCSEDILRSVLSALGKEDIELARSTLNRIAYDTSRWMVSKWQ